VRCSTVSGEISVASSRFAWIAAFTLESVMRVQLDPPAQLGKMPALPPPKPSFGMVNVKLLWFWVPEDALISLAKLGAM